MKIKCPNKLELLNVIRNCANIQEMAQHYGVSWHVVNCWMRWLDISMRPTKESLIDDCDCLTDKEIAAKYKVSDKTVVKWKSELGISKKRIRLEKLPNRLSQLQEEVITGKLLGDGHIGKIRSPNANTYLGIEQCLASKEYVLGLHELLKPFSLPVRYKTRKNPFRKGRNHVKSISSCLFNTTCHPVFNELRKLWYPDGEKVVPHSLILTWRTIAVWFCDDGCNCLGHKCCRRHGAICTNSFSDDDVEFLIQKLEKMGVHSHIYYSREQPMIHISKDSFMYFLENVRPYIPWKCMQYKVTENAGSKL